jgi:peptide/nickel transport system permease protein
MLHYRYIINRLLYLIPVLILMSIIVFASLHLMPGDAADLMLGQQATPEEKATLYRKLGLDRPLVYQYLSWAGDVIRGDFGNSLVTNQPVLSTILERLPASMLLGSVGALISVTIGLLMGIIASVNRGSLKDLLVLVSALLGVSVPIFWLGVFLIMVFSLRLSLFPRSLSEYLSAP